MYFTELIIKDSNETVNAKPIIAYELTDIPFRRIVLYNITYTNSETGENISSIIPYYISDGKTNNFRANMLYPFICINDQHNPLSGCPCFMKNGKCIIDNDRGTLIKNNIVKNIDLNPINRYILSEIRKKYPSLADDFENIILPRDSLRYSAGVASVLRRIENILNFFIAIYTDRIMEKYDINTYIPNIFGDPFDYSVNSPQGNNESSEYINLYNEYRYNLLYYLNETVTKFTEFRIINYRFIDLEFNPILLDTFNNLEHIKTCMNEPYIPPVGKIDDPYINNNSRLNLEKYVKISSKLLNMMRNIINFKDSPYFYRKYFEQIVPTPNMIKFKEDYNKFFTSFNNLIRLEPRIINEPRLDILLLADWNAKCIRSRRGGYYKKYLKYKQKYLELKKMLN
jgi:hypothetical protein